MPNIFRIIRSNNWWDFKIPPLLFITYLLILYQRLELEQALLSIVVVLFSISSAASFGHIVNDIFDIEEDQKKRKPNAMAELHAWQRAAFLILFVVTGFITLIFAEVDRVAIILLGTIYVISILYSVPPFRLKERGVWGVLADATAAHALPTLLVITIMGVVPSPGILQEKGLVLSALIWQFSVGLRGILIHQQQDLDSDVEAGTLTFARGTNHRVRRNLVRFFIFPIEMAGLIGMSWIAYDFAPILIWIIVGYLILTLVVQRGSRKLIYSLVLGDKDISVSIFDLYETVLPLAAAGIIVLNTPRYYWILFVHLILFHRKFYKGYRMMIDLVPR